MQITWSKPLFAWDALEDSPTLQTLREALHCVPDTELLDALRAHRGRGRDDYPVRVLWGVVLVRVLCRHVSWQAVLDDLRRNPALRALLGIEGEDGVPSKWNVSRFLTVLGTEPHLSLLRGVFDAMVGRLAGVVDDLGEHVAGDATGLSARPARGKGANPDGLPEPAGGRKEYTDEEGNVTEVVEWFGYKLQLLADTRHEVALAYQVTSTKTGDNEPIEGLVDGALANLGTPYRGPGEPAGGEDEADPPPPRIQTLTYDPAADDKRTHELLAERGIKPVIRIRSLWKHEPERMLPGHDGRSNIVYDEAGTVYCYDVVCDPPVRRRMAYIGHEPARGTLKYRCPARHEGWACRSEARCNTGLRYGKTVRVPCEIDLRRFPPLPRATRKFERLYRGRSAVERVNGRLKVFWGVDDGNITGAARFHAHVGVVMVAHLALATVLASVPRRDGTLGTTRLAHVTDALRAVLDRER
jgi:hypothetical protein